MIIEEIKNKMNDDLREEMKEGISYSGWKEMIQYAADNLKRIEEIYTIEELKRLALDELGYEDTDWMD